MSRVPRRESPLTEFHATPPAGSERSEAGCEIRELAFLGHINLRGDPADARFLRAVEGVVGFGLPLQPNTLTENRETTAFWLGPNEWLLLTARDQETRIAQALRDALTGIFAAVSDVSSGQTVLTLRGSHARDLLGKGCSLDLHPRVFAPGRCAQTLLATAGVLLSRREESFEIVVRRSFADFLGRWLEDAAQEFGLKVIPPVSE